jgi:hypothetical protein
METSNVNWMALPPHKPAGRCVSWRTRRHQCVDL